MNKELIKKYFSFLESDYGMVCEESSKKHWGYQAVFANASTVVQLAYETRECYLFISLSRKNEEGYDLNDVATLSGGKITLPHGLTLEDTVSQQADKLKTYGAAILRGDFHQFPELERIVEARAAALAKL